MHSVYRLAWIVFAAFGFALATSAPASASTFTFVGTSSGGTASATMSIELTSTNTLTLKLTNTSPTTLDVGVGSNAPGITAFGFDLLNSPLPSLTSWSLTANQYSSGSLQPVVVGSSTSTSLDWVMGTEKAGLEADYLPQNKGMDGALFNPAALDSILLPGGRNSVYYTEATLVMTFSSTPLLDASSTSPFVRFQNVGLLGLGSVKATNTVPEPASMFLVSSAVAIAAYQARRRKRTQADR